MNSLLNLSLFSPGDRVLVGLSGGTDSLALLHLLRAGRAELPLSIGALHVHHGMRGAIADKDVAHLRELCAAWEVPLFVDHADVPALAEARRVSVEEAGRDARYGAFRSCAREHGFNRVATAHHADDQVETVLLNLFRGAGIDGLAGIPLRRPLTHGDTSVELVRPLLHVWKRELEEHCRTYALEVRDDCTNRDLAYRRNRVRAQLLPALAEYDPAVKEHLLRLSRQAVEEAELLTPAAEAVLSSAGEAAAPGARGALLTLKSGVLAGGPPALTRRALRLALRRVGGYEAEIDAALIGRLEQLVAGTGPSAVDLPGCAVRARRVDECIRFEQKLTSADGLPAAVEVPCPGTVDAPEFRLRLTVLETERPPDPRRPAWSALLDAAAVCGPLRLRAPETGDRFRPLGAPGSRLLSDVFIDRKVPQSDRRSWPVLVDDAGIVWVMGLAVAERMRVGADTEGCWEVTVDRFT